MAKRINLTRKNNYNNYSNYLYKSRKKPITIGVVFVVVLGIILGIFGVQMYSKRKLVSAKSKVKTFASQIQQLSSKVDPYSDIDLDGLTNAEEEKYNTNYLNTDTDGDGLRDGDEVSLGLDPLNADTDNDGIPDGLEILAQLDPKSPTTDGIDDLTREFTYENTVDEITAEVKGDAFVYGTLLEKIKLIGFSANSSIITDAYEIYNDHGFNSCKITFDVDKKYIASDISVYKFDVNHGGFEKIQSTVNADGTVSANITQFGTYMVAESSTISQEAQTRIHFLIDNSGSMYPQEIIPNSPENDTDFKRLDFAKELIEKFDDSYTIAISKFTKDYTFMQDFTSDKKLLNATLDSIKTWDEDFNGTYIQSSLEKCMETFGETDGKTVNIIVLITDGDSTESTKPDVNYISQLAKEKNIIIITVSIGNNIDKTILSSIAKQTDGKYYSASDANLLGDIHNQIVTALNYDKVSISETGIGYAMYDTGFVPSVDGFSFEDYATSNSDTMSFGLCVFARNWFTKNLTTKMSPLTNDAGSCDGYDLTGTIFEKNLASGKKLREFSFIAVTTSRFIDPTRYLNFENSKGTTLSVLDDIKIEALSKGWSQKNYTLDSEIMGFKSVNFLALDVVGKYEDIEATYGKDEASFYKTIEALNLEYYNTSKIGVSLNTGFSSLSNQLADGIPAVLVIDGKYAVNAISLVRNAQNPSEYVLKVYDPRYKDRVTEVNIKKNVNLSVAKDGTVKHIGMGYSATIDGENVAVTIY